MADVAPVPVVTPTVYFIDDSATMREVIKIAFRRENIHVVACHDANTAFQQIEQLRPDLVISDVIMPDKDGYEVCQYIKQHPSLGKTPVVLMSGVVNRSVAEKAFAVKADELIRKPFQPQDLITRVRHLLRPGASVVAAPPPAAAAASAAALSSIFSAQAPARPRSATPPSVSAPAALRPPAPPATTPAQSAVATSNVAQFPMPVSPAPVPVQAPRSASSMDSAKLKLELMRLEGLVKKLQAELEAEREYSRALEAHIKTLQETE